MITLLKHGIFIHTDAEGAIIQSVSVENKKEESTLSGMVNGVTQIKRVWNHSETQPFSVSGSGDITFSTGVLATSEAKISLLTGGVVSIPSFKYDQKIGEPSSWGYNGTHFPYATAGA